MESSSDSDHRTIITSGAAPRKTYNIVAATTALVVFGFLAYALTQIMVKLSANKHRNLNIYYASGLVHGGTLLSVMDRGVVQYLNLRYAQVPERFGLAEPYEAKVTGDEMQDHPQPCARGAYNAFPSHPFPMSEQFEDCLFLNVWTPLRGKGEEDASPKAVVVVLVGGNFMSGGSGDYDLFDGSVMASLWNQVIVIPNYRVGMLGFYTMPGDNTTHGAGIADQVLVLEWVRTHISSYGGDPKKVTLLGHEAGATAVGLHLLSPTSSALFNRAILLSGSPYRPMPMHADSIIRDISHELLCSDEVEAPGSDEHITSCLKMKSVQSLLEHLRWATLGGAVATFNPWLGGTPVDLYRRSPQVEYGEADGGVFESGKDVLVGTTDNEGSAYTSALLSFFGVEHETDIDRGTASHILEAYLRHHNIRIDERTLETFLQRNDTSSTVGALARAIGDFTVHCPVKRFIESYTRSGQRRFGGPNVYAYYFRHVPNFRWWPYWMGSPQMLDWLYLSGNLQSLRSEKINIGDTEILLSKNLAILLSCFALTGNPQKCSHSPSAHWMKTTNSNVRTLVVENATTLVMRDGLPFGEACQKWDAVYANYSAAATRTQDSAEHVLNDTRIQLQRMQPEGKDWVNNQTRRGGIQPLAITRLSIGGHRVPTWAKYLAGFIRENNLERLNWTNIDTGARDSASDGGGA
ncbi:acetylcholinesterase-like [Dermacentor andersoni]|uniref:acetylcholinesterase-like n=1 Tax=Dermacentor andersoni TaxID=34620 RepID=UPI002415A428|nr:cholinesterase 1-like [Dermacentor andersoni]